MHLLKYYKMIINAKIYQIDIEVKENNQWVHHYGFSFNFEDYQYRVVLPAGFEYPNNQIMYRIPEGGEHYITIDEKCGVLLQVNRLNNIKQPVTIITPSVNN